MELQKKMRSLKHSYRIGLIIILVLLLYISINVLSICNYSREYSEKKSDVAIVLGAACTDEDVSEVYRQRLNHAVELFQNKKTDCIITTGGIGEGNSIPDAEVAKAYLTECGIPEEAVLTETSSRITQENLENSKIIMDKYGFHSALIVSDPLHMKRSMLLAKDAGIEAYPSPTQTSAYKSLKSKAPFVARETFFYIGYKWYRLFRFFM